MRKEEFERRTEKAKERFVPLLGSDEKIILMSQTVQSAKKAKG